MNIGTSDKFDLTIELERYKNEQWTIKYKYKLIKAINSKYKLIQFHIQNRTQKRFQNKSFVIEPPSLIPIPGTHKLDKMLNTDPDIIEMLDQLK